MATLRSLPSMSPLLPVSRAADSGPRFFLARPSWQVQVRVRSRARASATRAALRPPGFCETSGAALSAAVGRGRCPSDADSGQAKPQVASGSLTTLSECANRALTKVVTAPARELALGSLVFALVCLALDAPALALGPGGPVMEEFWDNVRRYGFYFITVVSGGLYSLTKPLLDLLKDPSTQILVLIVTIGTIYLVYLTVSTMLGLNEFVYQYAQ